ncbi:MAG: crosslink repair DNA glycosylase YcaQ family protein [Byssovorax sp.]
MRPLSLTPDQARRFQRRALLLESPAVDLGTALAHLAYVQIDPINVTGRMHEHILRNRVSGYREGALHAWMHAPERPAYEHYLPGSTAVLVAWPAASWPFLAARIRRRTLRGGTYGKKLSPAHEALARRILAEIAARGPLTSDDIEHEGRSPTGWGTPGRLVKNILEILFVHGRVLITARRNFRRVYDLPERVLPPSLLAAPEVDDEETARWLVLVKLRQRRLVALKRGELPLVAGDVQPIEVEGCPTLHILRSDLPLLEDIQRSPAGDSTPLLLAPLDPLIYDRRLASSLWGFDYTWEVYTKPEKRMRGYYALPILAGSAIVGHVDPKADRPAKTLEVMSSAVARGHRVAPALDALARFLGLERVKKAPRSTTRA